VERDHHRQRQSRRALVIKPLAGHRDHDGNAVGALIRSAISVEAFDPIASTLPLGSLAFDNKIDKQGRRLIWLDRAVVGPSSIPSLGDGVMLGTAWIDRPVDTQGCAPCFDVLLSAAWKRGHAQANDRYSYRVFAMPPRGFVRTTRTADTVAAA
jgi:hypothetical protein